MKEHEDARTKLMEQLSRIAPTLSEEQKAERVDCLLEAARQPWPVDGPIIRMSPPSQQEVADWAKANCLSVVSRLGLSLADLYEVDATINLCGCFVCRVALDAANGVAIGSRQIDDFSLANCPCATCRLIREALLRTGGAGFGEDCPLPTGARLLHILGLGLARPRN